jgi:hypothetical protein
MRLRCSMYITGFRRAGATWKLTHEAAETAQDERRHVRD